MSDLGFDLPEDSEEEEIPDWLQGLGGESQPGSEPPFEASDENGDEYLLDDSPLPSMGEEGEEEVPGWLSDIKAAESGIDSAAGEPPSTGDTPQGDDPGWLENIRRKEQARQTEQEASSLPDDFDEIDDGSTPQAADSGDVEAQPPQEDSGPDWLSGLTEDSQPQDTEAEGRFDDAPPQQDESFAAEGSEEAASTAEPPGFVDTGSLPSWLVKIKRGEAESASPPADDSLEFTGEADTQDELSSAGDFEILPDDLPSWLPEESPPEAPAEDAEEPPQAESPPDLARANLPNWLYAMRPVESPYGPEEGPIGHEETIGPLAGLQDLIPAEPDIIQFGKPPTFSLKLDVTANHERSTGIFEEVIADEGKPPRAHLTVEAITQGAVRWVIAALLLLATAVPVMLASDSIPLPDPVSPHEGALGMQNFIDGLSPGGPVLVAFDYQPAFTGELSSSSAAVFDHLLIKGAQLAILSTHPTGASQGENFLQQNLAAKHSYIEDRLYTDLGYLAGGASGLRAFASSPAQTLPEFIDIEGASVSVWDWTPLDQVETVADFAMVLVLTDSPEVARDWIEQVEPLMGETPLAMIVSEQAEPFLIPYSRSDADQIDALMAGIQDGAYYESTLGTGDLARAYWNSYGIGLSISVAVIFLGSLVGGASMLLSRLRKPAKEPNP
jgi:hypothetical protein